MRRRTFVRLVAASGLGALVGCAEQEPIEKPELEEPETPTAAAAGEVKDKPPYPVTTLCGKCGQVKGSDKCCKPGAEKCANCGLDKDAPGCCRIQKGTAVTLCGKCGQIKGSDKCCKPGAEKCANCGLDKGSPGCCRINKAEVQRAAMAAAA